MFAGSIFCTHHHVRHTKAQRYRLKQKMFSLVQDAVSFIFSTTNGTPLLGNFLFFSRLLTLRLHRSERGKKASRVGRLTPPPIQIFLSPRSLEEPQSARQA